MYKNKPYVFISYRSTDKEVAYETKNILEQNGIESWMAPESIPAGSDYGAEIPKALEDCSAFLILLSKDAQQSRWIPKEIDGAINNGKVIIPFRIDDSDITAPFNFRLGDSQRIEAYNRMSEAYAELLDCLKKLIRNNDNEILESQEVVIRTAIKIDPLGRILLPREVRRAAQIQEGDLLAFIMIHDRKILLKKIGKDGEYVSQVDAVGRIEIPRNIRRYLNITENQKISISLTEEMDVALKIMD